MRVGGVRPILRFCAPTATVPAGQPILDKIFFAREGYDLQRPRLNPATPICASMGRTTP
jgi:hypothetical protein